MKGQHAAPRQGATVPEIMLTGMAAPLMLAVILAVLALWALFLLLRGTAGVLARIPSGLASLERTWFAAALSWGLLLVVLATLGSALAEHAERDPRGEGAALGAAIIFALAFTALGVIRIVARRLGRQQFRESGGRSHNPQRESGGEARPSPASNAARLDEHSGQLDGLEALRDEVEAMKAAVAAAFAHAGTPVPPPAPERHLYAVPGPDDDTKPFGQIA